MRGIGIWAALLAVAAVAAPAEACFVCTPQSRCTYTSVGAWLCSGNGLMCSQMLPCRGGRGSFPVRPVALFVTFHDDDARDRPLVGSQGGRKVRGAGRAGSLDDATRVAGEALARTGAGGRVSSGRFVVGSGAFTAAFRSPRGAGWSLSADPGPGGVRVTLRELGGAGRVSARDVLAGDEALVARLRLEGRPVLAVVRAIELAGDEAAVNDRLRELQEPFYAALRALPEAPEARWEGSVAE